MSVRIASSSLRPGGASTHAVAAGPIALTVEFDPEGGPGPDAWLARVTFDVAEHTLSGQGPNRRAAFVAAISRFDVAVRNGHPLPAVTWTDVEDALRIAGAF